MTNSFAATHSVDVSSKAVDTVTYNENTHELVLDWDGALYKYSGVPIKTYEQVVAGTYKNGLTDASVGRAAQRIKKDFGPGEYLGQFGEVSFVRDNTKATKPTFPPTAQPAALKRPTAPAAASQTFSLSPVPSAPAVGTTYTVDFTVEGLDASTREYTPKGVNSVDEAIAALSEALSALGLTPVVKGVYVDFDGADE